MQLSTKWRGVPADETKTDFGTNLPEGGLADGKAVVAGENEVERSAIRTHPFGWETGGFARADTPFVSKEHGGPRVPRFRAVVDGKSALEAGVFFLTLSSGKDLHP